MSAATCTVCGKPGVRGEAFVLGVGMSPVCADCHKKGTVVVAPGDPLGRENKQAYAAYLRKLAIAYDSTARTTDREEHAFDLGRAEGLKQASEVLLNGIPQEVAEGRATPAKRTTRLLDELPAKVTRPAPPLERSPPTPPATNGAPTQKAAWSEPNQGLTIMQRRLLTAIVRLGEHANESRVSFASGYSPSSGNVDTALADLRSAGYLVGFRATDDGRSALGATGPLPPDSNLVDYWVAKLSTMEGRLLRAVAHAHPKVLSHEELCERAGYSVTSGNVDSALAKLRRHDFLEGFGLTGNFAFVKGTQ